jgi:hypothetical protein
LFLAKCSRPKSNFFQFFFFLHDIFSSGGSATDQGSLSLVYTSEKGCAIAILQSLHFQFWIYFAGICSTAKQDIYWLKVPHSASLFLAKCSRPKSNFFQFFFFLHDIFSSGGSATNQGSLSLVYMSEKGCAIAILQSLHFQIWSYIAGIRLTAMLGNL